jgi:hypothetical protein
MRQGFINVLSTSSLQLLLCGDYLSFWCYKSYSRHDDVSFSAVSSVSQR